jgi:hypothetical protein
LARVLAIALLAVFGALITDAASARTEIIVGVAPPPPVVEMVPAPRPGWVWAPGYYRWRHHHHAWVPGRWIRVRPGFHWVPDAWVPRGSRYVFIPGHWER